MSFFQRNDNPNNFSEQKNTSKSNTQSPNNRVIYRAQRKNHKFEHKFIANTNNPKWNAQLSKFQSMTTDQYQNYQRETEPHRMEKKRSFDVMSSGSNPTMHNILANAPVLRVPDHCIFYVRIDENIAQKQRQTFFNTQITHNASHKNLFQVIMDRDKSETKMEESMDNNNANYANNHNHMNDNDNHTMDLVGTHSMQIEEDNDCNMNGGNKNKNGNSNNMINQSKVNKSVSIVAKWVCAWTEFEKANNFNDWRQFNKNGRIHEYQINRVQALVLLNLGESANLEHCHFEICQWTLDHNYFGFILNGIYYLHLPHLYWKILDDNKIKGKKQMTISDLFMSHNSKPINHPFRMVLTD